MPWYKECASSIYSSSQNEAIFTNSQKKLSSQENTTTMSFLDKLCRQKEASIGPKGKIKNKKLDSSELKVLEEAGFHVTSSLQFFPSCKHGDFVTSMAKMHNSRNNSICNIRITDKPHVEEFFGSIQIFCFIWNTNCFSSSI